MAGKKDDDAQKVRAARLRRQMAGGKAGPPTSPREFIEEKMREKAPVASPPRGTGKRRRRAPK